MNIIALIRYEHDVLQTADVAGAGEWLNGHLPEALLPPVRRRGDEILMQF
jgi:hypothetical protein